MQVLVKIGFQRLWLPSERGVATLQRLLATAREVKSDNRFDEGVIELGAPPMCVVEMLPGYALRRAPRVTDIEHVEVLRPERAGAAALPAGGDRMGGRLSLLAGRRALAAGQGRMLNAE